MCRKINTEYFICCETSSQGMWNGLSSLFFFFWCVVSKTEQFLGAQLCFDNILSRSGLSSFISVLSVLSAPLANGTVCAKGNKKSPLSDEALRTGTRPVLRPVSVSVKGLSHLLLWIICGGKMKR